jgi:predicted transcriptional regulator with HTH domain
MAGSEYLFKDYNFFYLSEYITSVGAEIDRVEDTRAIVTGILEGLGVRVSGHPMMARVLLTGVIGVCGKRWQ